jgi:hypothetical protein
MMSLANQSNSNWRAVKGLKRLPIAPNKEKNQDSKINDRPDDEL